MKNYLAILLLLGTITLKDFTEAVSLSSQDKLAAHMLDDDEEVELEIKPDDRANAMIDVSEIKNQVSTMWSSAADTTLIDTEAAPVKSPFHFDLAGLAQGLSQTASVAHSVGKLQKDVAEAESALKTHQGHVADIKDLLSRAQGEQKFQLTEVLKTAQNQVDDLKKTVDKAHEHLNDSMKDIEKDEGKT